jgi:uncharacterized RmlC-like cupin family protein
MPMSINRASAAPVVHMPGGGESTSLMGMTIVCKVTGQQTGGQFSLVEITEPTGSGSPAQYNQVISMACYMLEGTMTLRFGDEMQEFGPGSFVYLPAGTAYQTSNQSGAPVKYLLFSTPAGMDEYFIEAFDWIQRQPAWPPEDMSELLALRTRHHFYDAPAG